MSRPARNFGWLSLEQGVRLATGFLVMTLVARHLGPDNFASYAWLYALSTLLMPLAMLGLNPVVMRTVPLGTDAAASVLGAALVLRIGASLLGAGLFVAVTHTGLGPAGATPALAMVAAAGLLAAPAETFLAGLLARERVTLIASLRTAIAVVAALVTWFLVRREAALAGFVAVRSGELLALALAGALVFLLAGRSAIRLPTASDLRRTLVEGLPFLCSALAALVYLRIDQLMLGAMTAPAELANYAIAARVSEMAMFLPGVLQSVCYPRLVRWREHHIGTDPQPMVLAAFAGAGWLVVGAVGFAAAVLLVPVFGPAYAGARTMTALLGLAMPFAFLASALQMLLNLSGRRWLVPGLSLLAALVNVALNLVLIPRYGGTGAAVATVVAALVSGLVPALVMPSLRPTGRAMLVALGPAALLAELRHLAGTLRPREEPA